MIQLFVNTFQKNGTSSSPGNSTESTSDENDNDQHSNVVFTKYQLPTACYITNTI